ncbi:flagellar hook-length control protein FliK [Rheinheimera sp. MMS21-TC3]|uniref:flagellar hook-length control protein FliK n=1 Tax=Rheinheimera sp. MMS21-TC3 TaxID=3072790 RepID=UPI0028C4AF68|nr:flagellar hook-length control protein FliK [Rheinheimera sp. MMS21-TC3]WNO61770.1 flagellar hook-length control protein FliK [Rheinheimera sp. MMS21-TC3]
MDEIKSTLASLVNNLALDKPAIKLVVAQIYQAQLQQLSSGAFTVQLPTTQGPLQLPLPPSFNWPQSQGATITASPQTFLVEVEFLSQEKNVLQLAIKSAINKINLPISQSQSQLITLALSPSLLQQLAASSTVNLASPQHINEPIGSVLINAASLPAAAVINATVSMSSNKLILTIANLAPIALSPAASRALSAVIQRQTISYGNEQPVQLLIRPSSSQLQLVTANSALNSKIDLSPEVHQAIQQQLRNLVNQQAPTLTLQNHQLSLGKMPVLNLAPQLKTAGLNNNYQVQILQDAKQWLLQLSSKPLNELVTIPSDKLNQTVQLLQTPATTSSHKTAPAISLSKDTQQQSVQHAWRQLLPLLAPTIDPLAELSSQEPIINKVLALIRQSQPDGNKVLSSPQLMQQLNSLLQFQPLQTTPNLQTGAGTLALAIQLLLGNLQQKATAPANQSTQGQRLASLIGQLEPAQASRLLRHLGTHSSALQQSQLNMLDTTSNQQLVLQLPLQQGQQSVLNQITIEQREADNKNETKSKKQWRLTMKFDLQQLGKLLVVASLQEQELQLQFYAEQEQAQRVTEKFLPLLKERCQAQGIAVNKAECVLGKIPDSLVPRTNSLVTIRV